MSDAWSWGYDPDAEHVVGGLPTHVVAEVERVADELAVLGEDATELGTGVNLRTLDILGGDALLYFLPDSRGREIVVVRVIWSGDVCDPR